MKEQLNKELEKSISEGSVDHALKLALKLIETQENELLQYNFETAFELAKSVYHEIDRWEDVEKFKGVKLLYLKEPYGKPIFIISTVGFTFRESFKSISRQIVKRRVDRVVGNKLFNLVEDRREADIQELCKQVLTMSPDLEYDSQNDEEYCYCPFCYIKSINWVKMSEMKHELDCAYLIAKDLSTNMNDYVDANRQQK